MPPPKHFLSYNRKDIDHVNVIARTLMLHGIRTWQDINNLGIGLTEAKLRETIQGDCSGLLFYSTESSIQSPMILQVELPEAEKRYKANKSFNIIPIFNLGIEKTHEALRDCLTIPISNFNGVKMDEKDPNILTASQEAAFKILNAIDFSKDRPTTIGLFSKQKSNDDSDLEIDLMSYFNGRYPSSEIWNSEICLAFFNLKNALSNKGITHVQLCSFAHLSLGFLFGYIFRERTGFTVDIKQISRGNHSIWTTKASPEENPLTMSVSDGDVTSKHLCVKINLMSQDDKSIITFCKQDGLSYRAYLEVSPSSYPLFISNGQAVAIARDLTDKIKQMNAQYGTNTVHIFAAVPLGLSLLIGYNLNACGKIQCYEFDNASRTYSASCILDSKY